MLKAGEAGGNRGLDGVTANNLKVVMTPGPKLHALLQYVYIYICIYMYYIYKCIIYTHISVLFDIIYNIY